MNFQANVIGGAIAGTVAGITVLSLGMGLEAVLFAFGAALAGALFPDLDVSSIPARWFGRLGFGFALLFLGMGLALESTKLLLTGTAPGLLALICMGMKHRGPIHKYWLPLSLSLLAFFGSFPSPLVEPVLYSFAVGICVHLMLDGIFIWSIRKGWLV